MARDPRKQQRKVERRKAKAKAKRKALAQRKAQGLADHLARAATMPILHCRAGSTIWDDGLGPLVVSRELSANSVAAAVFLLDVYCLGVKDVWSALFNRAEYDLRGIRLTQVANAGTLPVKGMSLEEAAAWLKSKTIRETLLNLASVLPRTPRVGRTWRGFAGPMDFVVRHAADRERGLRAGWDCGSVWPATTRPR